VSKSVHRLGDSSVNGGTITSISQNTVYVDGLLVSIDGSEVEGSDTQTSNGSPTVFIAGVPVNRTGDSDTSGDPRDAGSPTVFIGD
jgi:uncharacterized Zn-binding protein involved in type VI secretion